MKNRGFLCVGIFHNKFECNLGGLMRSALCFGAAYVFTIGRRYKPTAADTVGAINQLPVFHYLTLDDATNHLPIGCQLVGVELADNAESLHNFTHPYKSCLLLGAEDHGLPQKVLERCHRVVQIPGLKHCLNVATAGSLVMYDRQLKEYQRQKAYGPKEVTCLAA